LFGRDAEMRKKLREQILKVTLDDLQSVAAKYFDSEKEHFAVVTNEAGAAESGLDATTEHL